MLAKLLAEMRRRGFGEPFSFHDLRRTCSTGFGELGCPDELNDLILGHVKRGVLAHYDHSKRIPERAEWLRRWADHVAECVGLTDHAAAGAEPRLPVHQGEACRGVAIPFGRRRSGCAAEVGGRA